MLYRDDDPMDRSTKNRPVFGLGSSFGEPQHHHLALVVVSYALAENFHMSDLCESGVGPPISSPSTTARQALPTSRANAETFRPASPIIAIFLPELLAALSPEKTVLVRN
jgi:hypothetical protein